VSENFDSLPRRDLRRRDVFDLRLPKQRVAGLRGHPGRDHIPDLLCRTRTRERRLQTALALLGYRAWCSNSNRRVGFLLLWPEYATDKVIESLEKLIRTTLAFGGEVSKRRITEERITAVERQVSANLLEVLNIADQARFEGRRGATNSAAAIEAASSIVRIAYHFEIIARGRIAQSSVLKHDQLLEHKAIFEQACCTALEIQLAKLERIGSLEYLAQSSAGPTVDLAAMSDDLASFQSTHLAGALQILFATQLESYRRLPILLLSLSLDNSLSKIGVSAANR
jgi:hypothetical protein